MIAGRVCCYDNGDKWSLGAIKLKIISLNKSLSLYCPYLEFVI